MEKIYKNNKEYLRFKIGDEFKEITGKGSFNKMKQAGIASDSFDAENGCIYPVYSGSTIGDAINGYSKKYNHDGIAIKVSKDGDAGHAILVSGKTFNGSGSFYLTSKLANEYFALLLDNILPTYQQGSVVPHVYFRDFKNRVLEVPSNYQEIALVIKRINKYKELSKQLSAQLNKQLKDYKLAILQYSNEVVKTYIKHDAHEKYIKFIIRDKFKSFSGKGSFNKMKSSGTASDVYDKQNGFIYPMYDASSQGNHIKGYAKEFNYEDSVIKVTIAGESGRSIFLNRSKKFNLENSDFLYSDDNELVNEYIALYFDYFLPKFKQGSAMTKVLFSYYKDVEICIPSSHVQLGKVIKVINAWEKLINETTKKMNMYIAGILKYTIKGEINE